MTQIEIFLGYEIVPAFENMASHIIEYNEWGQVNFSIYPKNSSTPVPTI